MGEGTLLVAFGREWVRGEEMLLLWGSLAAAFPRGTALRPPSRTG